MIRKQNILLMFFLLVSSLCFSQSLNPSAFYNYFNKKDTDLKIILYNTGWQSEDENSSGGISHIYFVKNYSQKIERTINPLSYAILQYSYINDNYLGVAEEYKNYFTKKGLILSSTKVKKNTKTQIYKTDKEILTVTINSEIHSVNITLNNVVVTIDE